MNKKPFLLNFRKEVPLFDSDEALEEDKYSESMQMSVLTSGDLNWNTVYRRRPTSCYTASHRIKGGYTASGKWRGSRLSKGRRDRRVGR